MECERLILCKRIDLYRNSNVQCMIRRTAYVKLFYICEPNVTGVSRECPCQRLLAIILTRYY